MYNNKAITSNDAVRNKFQLELANRFENLQINEDDTVQTAYLRGRKDWERKKYAKLKNANQLIVFGNAELKTAIHRFFVKCENKNCEVLSKNWKNLHFTMLISACTNYTSWYESNFFNMKSETIIVSDIKLFSNNDGSRSIHFFSPKQTSMSHNTINCPWYQKSKIAKSWNLE